MLEPVLCYVVKQLHSFILSTPDTASLSLCTSKSVCEQIPTYFNIFNIQFCPQQLLSITYSGDANVATSIN
jgi:hypothetical protein